MLKLHKITIAMTNASAMQAFYDTVLDCQLTAFEPFPGATFYQGTLAGIDVLFCPNSVAGVDANQNRQQFAFEVANVRATLDKALANGGTALNDLTEHEEQISAAVYDPDGNSIEFIQCEK